MTLFGERESAGHSLCCCNLSIVRQVWGRGYHDIKLLKVSSASALSLKCVWLLEILKIWASFPLGILCGSTGIFSSYRVFFSHLLAPFLPWLLRWENIYNHGTKWINLSPFLSPWCRAISWTSAWSTATSRRQRRPTRWTDTPPWTGPRRSRRRWWRSWWWRWCWRW